MQTVEDYISFLEGKGFHFQEDAVGFIYFGKHYTSASDELVIVAIELTLKAQLQFEGSFYISLLETFTANGIKTRKEANHFVKEKDLIVI